MKNSQVLKLCILFIIVFGFTLAGCQCACNEREQTIEPPPKEMFADEEIFSNHNPSVVENGPTKATVFTLDKPRYITSITDYHWNDKQGSTPGTIAVQDKDGNEYGPWQTIGIEGQGGVPNAYWQCTPNIELPAGTYTIIDSQPSTWAQNMGSGGEGFARVRARK